MRNSLRKMILHNRPTLGIEEENAARRVIKSGWLAQGPEVEFFENEFCQHVGLPTGHAVALSSGTAALFLALWVLESNNKKVVIPGYACSALRHAVALIGGSELYVDVEQNSPNVNINEIKESNFGIAIIPHMYGIPIDLSTLQSENVIEDCAQALGAKVHGKSVGLQGKIGIFSFSATKLITSGGQGGMIISKDKSIIDKIKDYREFDYRHDKKSRFNFQMTDLQAAIGREQLKKLPSFLRRRKEIYGEYKQCGINLLDIPAGSTEKLLPVRYRAIMKTTNPKKVIDILASANIKAIIPTEDWELLGEQSLLPFGTELSRHTVSLPIYPSLTDDEVQKIIFQLNNVSDNQK